MSYEFMEDDINEIESRGKKFNEYAERAIIGAMLLSPERILDISEILKAEDFYFKKYMILFDKIKEVAEDDVAKVEPQYILISLEEENLLDEIGGQNTIYNIINEFTTSANVMRYAEVVKAASKKRELVSRATEIIEFVDNKEVSLENIIDEAHRIILSVNMEKSSSDIVTLRDMASEKLQYVEKVSKSQKNLIGIDTGYNNLNNKTSGLRGSDLIILAARPGMGKTAFALNLSLNAAKKGHHVLVFSLEMGNNQLFDRLLAIESELELSKIRDSKFNDDGDMPKLTNGLGKLEELPLYISDTSSLDLFEIKRIARKLHANKKLDFIVIDYLQLISTSQNSRKSREQEISEISRGLKLLAKELNVPILTLSQLSRGVESRADKRPLLSDLRESGAIEQDADMVMFLYRDAYYSRMNGEQGENSEQKHNTYDKNNFEVVELSVSKYRNGSVGTINLGFKPQYQKFVNLLE